MRTLLVGLCALALSSGASAALIQYDFVLEGAQEVPPNASPATGNATVIFDTATNELSWNFTYSGLVAPITASHFHGPAAPGVNAGVQVGVGALPSPIIGSTTITAAQAADLQAGLWYYNIHSSAFPGGEIRGQVVPEPSTLALLGLAALSALKRR